MSSSRAYIVLAFILSFYYDVVQAFPSGAGTQACTSLVPQHDGIASQQTIAPFEIAIEPMTIPTGGSVRVTISSTDGITGYRGLVIQARTADGSPSQYGSFGAVANFQEYDCESEFGAGGMTHTNRVIKTLPQTFVWVAPPDRDQDVFFHVTIVREFSVFWANFRSPLLPIGVVVNNPPIIQCPSVIPTATAGNVNYQITCMDANPLDTTFINCNPASGSFFPTGTSTPVTCTCSDSQQAMDDCSFNVVVNSPPIIQCPPTITTATAGNVNYPITCTDPNQSDNTFINCNPASGSFFPTGTSTPVTCTCRDSQQAMDDCSFNVVVDNNDPIITCPPAVQAMSQQGNGGTTVSWQIGCTDEDQDDSTLVVRCSRMSGTFFAGVGDTPVSCTCTDNANAVVTCNFIVTVQEFQTQDDPCLPGWVYINERCLLLVNDPSLSLPDTHEGRRLECLGRRGDLAKLDPLSVYQPILSQFLAQASEIYIGLTDLDTEGTFRWVVDDAEPTQVGWGSNEPFGGFQENCVTISGANAAWSDRSCDLRLPFLCERSAENPTCGVGPSTPRVFNGQDVVGNGRWPWQGSLGRNEEPNCGATLISAEWAITAAHCFGYRSIDVFFGDITQSPRGFFRQVSDVTWFLHPRYNAETFEYDLALLHLRREVELNQFVTPACIYRGGVTNDAFPSELNDLEDCYVTGWGETEDSLSPNTLQEGPVNIFPALQTQCQNYGSSFDPTIMLCAGDISIPIVDACQGDSGGPLICRSVDGPNWNLAGVVSFGQDCADPDFLGIYTRISTTRGFLDMTRRNADNLFKCPSGGPLLLYPQVCDNIVNCPDYADEIGCDPLAIGQQVQLNSPKFAAVTNVIQRTWIYFPGPGRRLQASFTRNTLSSPGDTVTVSTDINGNPISVPLTNPLFNTPSVVQGQVGRPIIITINKTSLNNIAGFQVTITEGI